DVDRGRVIPAELPGRPACELTAPKRVSFEDKDVHLHHRVEVNDIETTARGTGVTDSRYIGLKPISQSGQERLTVVGQQGRPEANVTRATGFTIERAGDRPAEK